MDYNKLFLYTEENWVFLIESNRENWKFSMTGLVLAIPSNKMGNFLRRKRIYHNSSQSNMCEHAILAGLLRSLKEGNLFVTFICKTGEEAEENFDTSKC